MPHTSKRQQQPEVIKPQDFYRGYNATWEPLEQDLDVRRGVSDDTPKTSFSWTITLSVNLYKFL